MCYFYCCLFNKSVYDRDMLIVMFFYIFLCQFRQLIEDQTKLDQLSELKDQIECYQAVESKLKQELHEVSASLSSIFTLVSVLCNIACYIVCNIVTNLLDF